MPKGPTPFEMAYAAHEGKIDPKELRGGSRYLYETQTKENLKKYIDRPADARSKTLLKGRHIRKARSW